MDSTKRFLDNRISRSFLGLNNFLILGSSAILTGILSHFIHRYHARGTHMVYQEVIAVLTMFLYLFALFLPALKSYRGYLLPLNLILSYLWLTSLIFSSQDWSGRRCQYNGPGLYTTARPGFLTRHSCGLKHTVQAFNIIGFSMLFLNMFIEAMMWASHRRQNQIDNGTEKDRTLPTTTTTTTTGAPISTENGHRQVV
ncbi:hypothetical protein B0H66DRAFT_624389 [Apodospora peruviana]|uniref:MARVEL domain-containing protein n=1 Tax=Apodospora peruviana TaxID=516989 RepID=A0AAE0M1K1_9PEZI|nr:hypothetical protein B0H66DRAFT_624389 [Apodospora peruviana]